MTEPITRRNAVKSTAALGALASAPQFISQSVFGANDEIIMGIIGAGGRGCGVMNMHQRNNAKFIAVCDVTEPRINEGVKNAARNNNGKIDTYDDYRKLLERKDIDAVLIATPEHQHCSQMIDAVQAGKDVYCEKPMSHSIEEGARTVKEVNKTDRIVQIGMQRRSAPLIHEGLKTIQSGVLGDVYMVKAQWNWKTAHPLNNSPLGYDVDWKRFQWPNTDEKFEPMKLRYWRLFWPFSGGITCDQGAHIMDVVQLYMGQVTPLESDSFGDVINYKGADTPDLHTCIFKYPNFYASWTINYNSSYYDWWHITFQGTKGTMHLHRFGYQVYAEPIGDFPKDPVIDFKGDLPSQPHVDNFMECVKTRNKPNAPVEVGHTAVCGPHLANVAYKNKRRAMLNPEATKVTLG
ncbi:Gfo/Idh/MocA family oxidoreductase [bacterium]|nr:Gfo/Idh/MocA family oxidoreductase [bacterium]